MGGLKKRFSTVIYLILIALVLFIFSIQFALSKPSKTQTLISSCQSISSPGDYLLTTNLASSGGTCISITANNVVLNCNGFWIIGGGGGHGVESFPFILAYRQQHDKEL